ncbi:hypothetical protein AAG747_19175 [Rapidithrix thailandica]|uniref:Uncharacterized protein n=1 Tax=Rapidithrix thailandica TaxID=413964 RepID=A0AAW9SCH0_9BACT
MKIIHFVFVIGVILQLNSRLFAQEKDYVRQYFFSDKLITALKIAERSEYMPLVVADILDTYEMGKIDIAKLQFIKQTNINLNGSDTLNMVIAKLDESLPEVIYKSWVILIDYKKEKAHL